jgi:hypothetical protein
MEKMIMNVEYIRVLKKKVVTYFMAYLVFTKTDSGKPVVWLNPKYTSH